HLHFILNYGLNDNMVMCQCDNLPMCQWGNKRIWEWRNMLMCQGANGGRKGGQRVGNIKAGDTKNISTGLYIKKPEESPWDFPGYRAKGQHHVVLLPR
ncbi:MAG: hypothetical protein LUG18_05635, partial [Candidatus Azobacteroides sp.]|nr:hypothetical protein [Candidatus Azobacteroides sp.]